VDIFGVLVFVSVAVCAVAVFIRMGRGRSSDIRKSCPDCRKFNEVEVGQLGTRVRCAWCGSLLYPTESISPASTASTIHIHNTNNIGSVEHGQPRQAAVDGQDQSPIAAPRVT
jgi:ribosomal protein S27E